MNKTAKDIRSRVSLPGVTSAVPVVQATLGCCDSTRLASAVSRAGGLGTFGVHAPDPARLRRRLRQIRARTPRPVLLAFTAPWEAEAVLDAALAEGFRTVQVFWWNGGRLAPRIRRGGGTVYWQVGTLDEAKAAIDSGADALIAQGTEAGGQVRSPHSVRELVAMLREAFGDSLPIIAGGGLADRRDTEAVLHAGASAALFGTRFLLSAESNADPRDKARLLRMTAHHLHLDTRLAGDWPCSPRRRLLTPRGADVPSLYAGLGIERIFSVRPAGEIVRALAPATILP